VGYKRILVPVDGSAVSGRGLQEAIKMARAGAARVRLLHVVAEYAAYAFTEASIDIEPVLDSLRQAGRRTLARIERRARASGVRIETSLVERPGGRVADAIVGEAKRWRADVIVMGTHGHGIIARALLGSVAERVIARASSPVMTVRAR
jgi:nucleotide-binding universal stress UspA family protein